MEGTPRKVTFSPFCPLLFLGFLTKLIFQRSASGQGLVLMFRGNQHFHPNGFQVIAFHVLTASHTGANFNTLILGWISSRQGVMSTNESGGGCLLKFLLGEFYGSHPKHQVPQSLAPTAEHDIL